MPKLCLIFAIILADEILYINVWNSRILIGVILAQIDFAKEELGLLKLLLGLMSGIFVALVGWLVTNYDSAKEWLLIACVCVLVIFALAGVFVMKIIFKKLNEIKEL